MAAMAGMSASRLSRMVSGGGMRRVSPGAAARGRRTLAARGADAHPLRRMPRRTDGAPAKEARHRRILAALATDPTVRISALAAEFGVSAETVRRDIEELSRQGAVRRTYGGASVPHAGVQPGFSERERMAVAERARI